MSKFNSFRIAVFCAGLLHAPGVFALEPTHLEFLESLAHASTSFTEMRPGFVKVADSESLPPLKKTTQQVVAELQALSPDYAAHIVQDQDYWKLSYLLDQGWDVAKPDSEGKDLLLVSLEVGHMPNIEIILRGGGWRIVENEVNTELLKKAGQSANEHLLDVLAAWESPRRRKKLIEGSVHLHFEGVPPKRKANETAEPMVAAVPPAMVRPRGKEEYTDVYVPYVTNRSITTSERPISVKTPDGAEKYYSHENSGALSYGVAKVTIPRIHEVGHIEKRGLLEFKWDRKKHVVLERILLQNERSFFNDLGLRMKEREALFKDDPILRENAKDLFVYIHGFNVDYSYAIKKTAQLIYDMDYPGLGIAFTWPARPVAIPMPGDFRRDASRAEASAFLLQEFFQKLQKEHSERTVHVIAHSLGTRVLTLALTRMADSATPEQMAHYKTFFGHIVLAAPAIDARMFSGKFASVLVKMCNKVSVIASDDDMALKVESLAEGPEFSFPFGLWDGLKAALGADMFNFDASALSEGTMSLDHSVYSVVGAAIRHIGMLLKKNPNRENEIAEADQDGVPYLFKSEREDYFSTQRRPVWRFLGW
jgi:esterase/lipase superfamily enzyme